MHDADDSSPSWSPIGDRIAFESDRSGNHDVYVMDFDGRNIRRLTSNAQIDGDPNWSRAVLSVSPTGKQFVMWGQLKGGENAKTPTIPQPGTHD